LKLIDSIKTYVSSIQKYLLPSLTGGVWGVGLFSIQKYILPALTGGVWGWVFIACESVTCPLNNTVESKYGFYAAQYNEKGELVTGTAIGIGDTLTVTLLGADSVILNRQTNKSDMSLPVSFYLDEDSIELAFTDTLSRTGRDTIWVSKRNQHHWDDPSCPVHMWHEVTAVRSSHNLIDTVLVTNPDINYDGLENFQIYFRTGE
jgi:hypothetical protein